MACIHGELIDDSLTKQTMVQISVLDGSEPAMASFITEIMIGQARSRTQYERDGNHKDIHENVEELTADML